MNKWKILGIEPTVDKKIIKRAYREKLKEVNPESHPEEFMKLREAYEKALEMQELELEIEEDEPETEEADPIEEWMEKLEALYADNEKRFLIECWEELLGEEVCYALETRAQIADTFLRAFAYNPHVSLEVLKLADQIFHFAEMEEELEEEFDSEFLDYFLNYRLRSREFPPYEYFAVSPVKDADYDDYIELAREFFGLCENEDRESAVKILEALDETEIKHPYVEIKRVWLCEEDGKRALEKIDNIEKQWGECEETIFAKGQYFFKCEQYDEAEKCFRRTQELNRVQEKAMYLLVLSLCKQEKYIEARKILGENKDPNVRMKFAGLLEEIENQIISQLEESLQAGVISEEDKYLLAVIYYRKGKIDDSEETLEILKNKKEWEIKCLRVLALIAEAREEWRQTLGLSELLLAKLEVEEKTDEHIAIAAEANMLRGSIFLRLKQKTKAVECMDCAIALEDVEEQRFYKASFLMAFHLYELAIEELTILIKRNPRSTLYRFGRGKCYYELGLWKEAYEDFEYVCMVDEEAFAAHIYKLRIYLQIEQWEDVDAMFRLFEGKNWDTDTVRMLKGVYQGYRGDPRTAEKMLKELLDSYNPVESDLEHVGELYSHLADIDVENGKRVFQVLRRLKKGLEAEPGYIPLLEKCWEQNENVGDMEDVEKYLREILRICPYHEAANEKLSEILKEDGKVTQALEVRNVREEVSSANYIENADAQILCGRYEEAWKNICLAERIPGMEDSVKSLKVKYYMAIGEDAKVLSYFENSIDKLEDSDLKAIVFCYCHLGQYEKAREWAMKRLKGDTEKDAKGLLYEIELECGNYEAAKKWNALGLKRFVSCEYQIKGARIKLEKQEYKMAKFLLDETETYKAEGSILLGALYIYREKGQKAMGVLKEGMKSWPEEAMLYYYAALANLLMGNETIAAEYAKTGISVLEKDERIGMKMRKYCRQMGVLLAISGEFERAKEYLDKALCAPVCFECVKCQCPKVELDLALLYHLMGNREACLQSLDKAGQKNKMIFNIVC